MPEGFVSKSESKKLRTCLLEISAAGPKLYSENEKHLLIRCRDSCKGSGCENDLCMSHTYYTQHESNVIYTIRGRIPVEKEPEPVKPEPKRKNKDWMTL